MGSATLEKSETPASVEVELKPLLQGSLRGFTVFSASEKNTEELRLIEPCVIHDYLNSLLGRLKPNLIRQYGSEFVDSIEIHVTDIPWLTCHANQGDKSLIVIDTTLFSKIETEDALVSILGHEIGHGVYRFINKIPNNYKATIEEENFCDLFGMQMAETLGLNPRGAEELFIELSKERQNTLKSGSDKYAYLKDLAYRSGDEHLTPEARVKNIQTAIGARRLITGDELLGSSSEKVNIPSHIKNILQSKDVIHTSHIDRWKVDNNYDDKTLLQQVELLNELILQVNNNAREQKIVQLIQDVSVVKDEPKDKVQLKKLTKQFDLLFDRVCEKLGDPADAVKALLSVRSLSKFWKLDIPHLGKSRQLERSVIKIKRALNHKELVKHCKDFLTLINANRELFFFCKGRLSDPFEMPSNNKISYDESRIKHTSALLKKAVTDKSLSIAKVICLDLRKFDFPINFSWDEFLDKFTLDQATEIIKHSYFSYREEDQIQIDFYLEARKRNESLKIDSAEFWKNPKEFLLQHRDIIKPPGYSRNNEITQSPYYKLNYEEANAKYLKFNESLIKIFQEAIDSKDEEKIRQIVEFFIPSKNEKLPFLPRLIFPEKDMKRSECSDIWPQFIVTNRQIFPLDRRVGIIKSLNVQLPADDSWLLNFVESTSPKTIFEVEKLLDKTGWLNPEFPIRWEEQYDNFILRGLTDVLQNNTNTESDLFELIKFHGVKYTNWSSSKELKEYRAAIRDKVVQLDCSLEKLIGNIENLDERIQVFFECDNHTLLSGVDERDRILAKIIYDIEELDDAEQIRTLSEKLLHNSLCLGAPELKNQLIEIWTDIIFEQHGIDSNFQTTLLDINHNIVAFQDLPSHDVYGEGEYSWEREYIGYELSYKDALIRAVDESTNGISGGLKFELFSRLADKIEAQPALCYQLEKMAKSEFSNQYGKSNKLHGVHLGAKGAEAFLEFASQDPLRKTDIIKFLCAPLDESNVSDFVAKVKLWDPIYSKGYSTVVGDYSTESERDMRYQMSAYDFHRNFWSLTPQARILVMDQILLPAKDIVNDKEAALEGALNLVLEKLFPLNEIVNITEKEKQERYWARTFLDLYIRSSNDTEWGLLLSCLLTASQSSETESSGSNTGKRLKSVFEALGPAYIKLGQAIHSYPGTPEDIKKEMAALKNNAAPLIRWDLFHRIEQVVPQDYLDNIHRYQPLLGSASFNIITEIILKNGEHRALAVLRENSLPLAIKGFNQMKNVVTELAKREPTFAPYEQDAINIILQAQKMTEIETNMEIGYKQSSLAKSHYDSRVITAGGKRYHFKVCQWGQFGDEWRDMELGKGTDIKSSSARQAILIAEMIQMLSGDEFDCDRHENQYKIDGDVIYVFDHGGMSLTKPTEEEKNQVGIILADIANKIIDKKPVNKAIAETLKDLNSSSDYIERIKKGLLALSFTFDAIKPKESLAVIFSVLGSADIDPTIKNSILHQLKASKQQKLALKFANIISAGIPGYGARRTVKIPFLPDSVS